MSPINTPLLWSIKIYYILHSCVLHSWTLMFQTATELTTRYNIKSKVQNCSFFITYYLLECPVVAQLSRVFRVSEYPCLGLYTNGNLWTVHNNNAIAQCVRYTWTFITRKVLLLVIRNGFYTYKLLNVGYVGYGADRWERGDSAYKSIIFIEYHVYCIVYCILDTRTLWRIRVASLECPWILATTWQFK